MTIPFLDLKRQYKALMDEIEPVIIDVSRSGAYIGGNYVKDFEDNMKDYLDVKHIIPCANGTDALMVALRAGGINPGDEVITTPFTFFASAEAIAAVGAVPVFIDIRDSDYNINAGKIESAITKKTKAIVPVHIFGWPCDMDLINSIAKKHDLMVVEDAAQAIGSEINGIKIGNSDNLVCFSFYPTKNLGAFGDAGMITTNDDELAIIARAFCTHGMAKNGAKAREFLTGVADKTAMESKCDALYDPYKYYNYLIGYNSRLDAVQAAVLNLKLKYLDCYNAARQKIAALYDEGLKDIVKIPMVSEFGTTCYHQYAICTEKKDELCAFLASKNIGTGAFYPVPLHLQKAFDYLGYSEGDLPIAEMICKQTVCLPIFPEMTDDEVNYVIQGVSDFFKA